MRQIYRQGDVLIAAVDEIPAKTRMVRRSKTGRIILAHGEVTGHAHAIAEPNDRAQLREAEDGSRFLQRERVATLVERRLRYNQDTDQEAELEKEIRRLENLNGVPEPVVMVEVVNSTAEPDGTYKDYWLRVPPTITTAREAVAWTFDVPAEEYRVAIET